MLIGYVQLVAAFVLLLFMVEGCLVACCVCSTEYGPRVGGYLSAHFCILCYLKTLYCLCVVSRSPCKYHLMSVSWDENRLRRLFYDPHDGSDNYRLEIALLAFLCNL